MVQNSKIQKLKFLIFFNNYRGIEITKIFLKNKLNFDIIITKKFLNLKVIDFLNKKKLSFKIIKNLKSLKIKSSYDIFIVAGFPHIFKKNLLNAAKKGVINLHAGPLPNYQGGSPLSWQIINNEKKIGITFFKMNKYLDKGKILLKKYFKLNNKENIKHAQFKANKTFAKYIILSIEKLLKKKFLKKNVKGKYYNQRSEKDGEINLESMKIVDIKNLIRALYPYYNSPFIKNNKKKIYIKNFSKISKTTKKKFIFKFNCQDGMIGLTKKDIISKKIKSF